MYLWVILMDSFKRILCKVFGHRWKAEFYRQYEILFMVVKCARCGKREEKEDRER